MNSTVRNILAVIAGLVIGGIINMALIQIGPSVIPPPNGADVTTTEGLKEAMHLFEPKHFIFPFLAHALGTLVGAIVAALIAKTNRMTCALAVGIVFLLGGIMMIVSLPTPTWYAFVDLIGAYILMAWIGGKLVIKNKGN